MLIFAFSPKVRITVARRFNPKQLKKDVCQSHRIASFKTTLNILKKKPLFGVGLGNYPKVHDIYRDKQTDSGIKTTDNLYLSMFCEIGIVGTVIFLIFIFRSVYCLWIGYKVSGDMTILVILIGIVGFLICSIAGEFFGWLAPQFAFWLLLGAGIGLSREAEESQ
jgi:O-antigen ligase